MRVVKFQLMLASAAPELLRFPLLASPKLDGIRAAIWGGQVITRNLKPIRNFHVQEMLSFPELEGLDGELISGPPTSPDVWNTTSSAVMSAEGEPEFQFHVFDSINTNPCVPFTTRLKDVREAVSLRISPVLMEVEQALILDVEQLKAYEEKCLNAGYEGVMLRSLNGPYKMGRSTADEGYLLKLKRFDESEARVIGYKPLYINHNTQERDERGYAKRSKAKKGMREARALGALEAIHEATGAPFDTGGGYTLGQRARLWDEREKLIGRVFTYKHQGVTPAGKPRFPVFKGWREDLL